MIETKHFVQRMNERGFCHGVVECILSYGEWNDRGDRLVITRSSKEKIVSDVKNIKSEIQCFRKTKENRSKLKALKKQLFALTKTLNRPPSILVLKENFLITIY